MKKHLPFRIHKFISSIGRFKQQMRTVILSALIALISVGGIVLPLIVQGNNTPQSLPFAQNWSNAGLITANDNWSGLPGVEGFLGQDITTATGTDPQTLLGVSALANDLDVIANQSNPNITNGGVAEFDGIANPTIALQGSGTADAPYLLIHLNTTGQTNINVAYNLRDIDASTDNAVQQVALQYRIGTSGNFTNLPAGYVADATTGPSLATLVTPVSVTLPAAAENQAEVQVRIITTNAVGNDEWVGVDDINITSGGGTPTLSINDAAVTEGNGGTVTASFTVSLSQPAGAGGVTFDIATQDNSATVADSDYFAKSLTGQTIPSGSSTYTFDVTVNGDTNVEANETFFVNVTNVTGIAVSDGQGVGTINNDDVTLTAIHDIQGNGSSSPVVGNAVTTRGIVTGQKSNGFFIQEPDAFVDADPLTSEGIFVFTSSAPPAAAAIGNLVQVGGTVQEFVPSADPLQPPLTEIGGSPTVTQISTANPLPAPIPLTATFPDPAGAFDQLERVEGMRVSVNSMTVVGPTLGTVNEPNATATSNGTFFGVVTGVSRPFREPGIQAPDPAPSGTIPPIPRFDTNPEVISVDSNGQPGTSLIDVKTGAVVSGLVGPLDYGFRRYTLLPDLASPPTLASTGITATAVATPLGSELTVASFNLERFYDTVNDPATSDVVLTPTAFNNRLNKASIAIRNFLKFPDILGVVEVENLTTLQALAAKISSDAVAASQPDPQYQAFLVEGNDIGGIDVGFLVKTSIVTGSTPRILVNSVTQEGKTTLFVNPDSSTELLNDRPSLVLEATVNFPTGATFPITVIVNHLRSLNGVDDPTPGSNGWPTAGERVRAKRLEQAKFLANLVQARQAADPTEALILVGDFNAFEFNDGYVDSMGTIQGTPVPDNQTAVPGDGVDLVNPDITNLFNTAPAAERYSFVFDGNAQSLDHILANAVLIANTATRRVEHPRINADFPETARNNATNAERVADHDPIVGFFQLPPCTITCPNNITVSNDTGQCGATISYATPTTSGNCGNVTCSPASGSFFSVGATTVTCTDTGLPGIKKPQGAIFAQCSFTVTVNDTQAPMITCTNITTTTTPGQCDATVTFTPTVIENCPGVTTVCNPASGSVFPKGTTTVNCTATDAATNSASCSFTVTVNDNEAPVITCPANVVAVAAQTCPLPTSATVNYATPTVTDNCPGATVVCTPPSGANFPIGTTTVSCTATDSSGNTASCSFAVTVYSSCLQDDTDLGNVVLFNHLTGAYKYCCNGSLVASGIGTVLVKGCIVVIQDNTATTRVLIRLDASQKAGNATIQMPPGSLHCTIVDHNTANNNCNCQ